jgi:hypothetical protein
MNYLQKERLVRDKFNERNGTAAGSVRRGVIVRLATSGEYWTYPLFFASVADWSERERLRWGGGR